MLQRNNCHPVAKRNAFVEKRNMKCPVCGAAELIHDTRDLPCTYKGETPLFLR